MLVVNILLLFISLFYSPQRALSPKPIKFAVANETFASFPKYNQAFYLKKLPLVNPKLHFIFIRLSEPTFISKIKIVPNTEIQIKLLTNRGVYYFIDNEVFINEYVSILVFIFESLERKLSVYTKVGEFEVGNDSIGTEFGKFVFYDRDGSILPLLIIKRNKGIGEVYKDFKRSMLVFREDGYLFVIREGGDSIKLLISKRFNDMYYGSLFEWGDGYKRELVKFFLKEDEYVIWTPLGSVLKVIPDSALVLVNELDSVFSFDIKYATENNFVGQKLYDCGKCLLRYEVARDLKLVAQDLYDLGYRLLIYDCYRPVSVQRRMWAVYPNKFYVAKPGHSSHNKGVAVDVGLMYRSGGVVDMGTEYDSFSLKSHSDYNNLNAKELYHRQLLKNIMELHHFKGISTEWWHFYHISQYKYKALDIPLPCD